MGKGQRLEQLLLEPRDHVDRLQVAETLADQDLLDRRFGRLARSGRHQHGLELAREPVERLPESIQLCGKRLQLLQQLLFGLAEVGHAMAQGVHAVLLFLAVLLLAEQLLRQRGQLGGLRPFEIPLDADPDMLGVPAGSCTRLASSSGSP